MNKINQKMDTTVMDDIKTLQELEKEEEDLRKEKEELLSKISSQSDENESWAKTSERQESGGTITRPSSEEVRLGEINKELETLEKTRDGLEKTKLEISNAIEIIEELLSDSDANWMNNEVKKELNNRLDALREEYDHIFPENENSGDPQTYVYNEWWFKQYDNEAQTVSWDATTTIQDITENEDTMSLLSQKTQKILEGIVWWINPMAWVVWEVVENSHNEFQIIDLQDYKDDLQDAYDDIKESIENVALNNPQNQEAINQLKKLSEELKETLDEVEEGYAELSQKVNSLETEINYLEDRTDATEQEVKKINEKITTLQDELNAFKEETIERKEEAEKRQEKIDTWQKVVNDRLLDIEEKNEQQDEQIDLLMAMELLKDPVVQNQVEALSFPFDDIAVDSGISDEVKNAYKKSLKNGEVRFNKVEGAHAGQALLFDVNDRFFNDVDNQDYLVTAKELIAHDALRNLVVIDGNVVEPAGINSEWFQAVVEAKINETLQKRQKLYEAEQAAEQARQDAIAEKTFS